jgi:putative Holliday junction resolvase
VQATPSSILGLDVGERRVGVAVASLESRLPQPLTTLERNDSFFTELQAIMETEGVTQLVIGLPRNLSGEATSQTDMTQRFVGELKQRFSQPMHLQDEAVTSKQAEAELKARGKTYQKSDIDALAATYILEDFLAAQPELTQ